MPATSTLNIVCITVYCFVNNVKKSQPHLLFDFLTVHKLATINKIAQEIASSLAVDVTLSTGLAKFKSNGMLCILSELSKLILSRFLLC